MVVQRRQKALIPHTAYSPNRRNALCITRLGARALPKASMCRTSAPVKTTPSKQRDTSSVLANLSDHTVKITTTYEALTSSLAPGDFIKVALDYTYYNQFVNGAVTGDGKLVSSTALADGTHTVVYWTGEQNAEVLEGTLTVSNGGTTASPSGIVFTVKTSEITTRTYRIDSIQPSDDGYEIEAVHTPMLSDGTLQLYAEWSDDSYWTEL